MSKSHSSSAKASREAGDKVFVGGSPADRAVLVADIIECMQQQAPKRLLITVSALSEYLHQQPALSPANLYRKQYGNLEHAFAVDAAFWSSIFKVENSVVKLLPVEALAAAAAAGHITPALLDKCTRMHAVKRKHDLETLKMNNKNECRRCGESFPALVNNEQVCSGQIHEPRFDFERSDDVMQCEIA